MSLNLSNKVEEVPLIGPLKAALLRNLEIYTVSDLLNHYPFRYDDFSKLTKIAHLAIGETVTIRGSIIKTENVYTKSKRIMVKATIGDETGQVEAIWFNQPYLAKVLKSGSPISLSGKADWFARRLALMSPDFELTAGHQSLVTTIHTGRLVPVYPETSGISSKWLRSRINFLLQSGIDIEEYLPQTLLSSQELIGLAAAISHIHFPQSLEEAQEAKKRLAFDEIFAMLLKSQVSKSKLEKLKPSFQLDLPKHRSRLNEFISSLPFQLTPDQVNAIDEILKDMEMPKPMNRLLQGDVGSGKTVVAAAAAYITHLEGFRTLYMAPTEILANQHFDTFTKLLGALNVKIELITGSSQKKSGQKDAPTQADIIIGTHALLYKMENFAKTGLVIIDEQHKFGVEQRTSLLEGTKSHSKPPHLLTMTATPIPRTLALTILGDLDLTYLKQIPKDRKPIKTWVTPKEKRFPAYEWIKKQLTSENSQAYIVCPFIEESEVDTLKTVKAAKKEFESLVTIFHPLSVELLHGKMKSPEKEEAMRNFASGKTQVLVSTPVVEVGVDNPNASIIVIEGADRFGLASLHQLRGRVGRGSKQSYCLLFTENEFPEVLERLKLLETYNSGLELSEMDLKRRGSGEVAGIQQSGFVKTKAADLSDSQFIIEINLLIKELIKTDSPILKTPQLLFRIEQKEEVHMD